MRNNEDVSAPMRAQARDGMKAGRKKVSSLAVVLCMYDLSILFSNC